MLKFLNNLFLAFNQIVYESAVYKKICKRASIMWMFFIRGFVPINRTVHTIDVDKSEAAYSSQKEQ